MYRKLADNLLNKKHYSEDKSALSLLYHMEFGLVTVFLTYQHGFYLVMGSGNVEYPSIKGDSLNRWKTFHKSTLYYEALRSYCDVCQHVLHNHLIYGYSWRFN